MRRLIILGTLLLGACGQEAPKQEAPAIPAKLPAGQYEVTATIASLASTDKTPLPIDGKVGDKRTVQGCVGADGLPDGGLLGAAGDVCAIENPYVRSGRMNLTLNCARKGKGTVMAMVDGKYTADGFTGTVTANSAFAGPGDYKLVEEISARKIADQCNAAPGGDKKA